jgi:glycerol uptake facilitator-like aquaporin
MIPLGRRLLAEGVGAFFLFATVIGSGVMAERLSGGSVGLALLANSLATGAILFVLIAMLGPVSGAHMNPAVSLVAAARRELAWPDAAAYLGAQLACGILGAWAAHPPAGHESPRRRRPMARRGDRHLRPHPGDPRHGAAPSGVGGARRRALHRCRLLVHVLD